ncbi:MAG: peptide chain release factor N(5)-glutamine methyltransferase [Desulfocapsaceae bacterium]
MKSRQEVWRIADLLQRALLLFERAGIDSPRTDAELLVAHCLSLSRTELYLRAEELVEDAKVDCCFGFLERRRRREPVAYITGKCEFWSQSFEVTPAVLIPRPETEILVERVLARKDNFYRQSICLDLCSGSGIIGITLALELGLESISVEVSGAALEVCRRNCVRHGVEKKVRLVQADLTNCFLEKEQFGLITANPPYVSRAEMESGMQPEVIDFEPALALDGGRDGLELIRRIVSSLPKLLAPGGDFFMEIGAEQGTVTKKLLADSAIGDPYENVKIIKDYSDRDRLVHVRKKN